MCELSDTSVMRKGTAGPKVPVANAVGMVLAHDITEIRPGEFKGVAFRKGHVVAEEDISHLQRLGKEHVAVLDIGEDELHEDDAARMLAHALCGPGVGFAGEPREGKLNLVALRDGILRVRTDGLYAFNLLGEVMCATLHDCTVVTNGRTVAGTRAIPLVVDRALVERAVDIAQNLGGLLEVRPLRHARIGAVITGNEVYAGRIKDAFGPVIRAKASRYGCDIVDIRYAPDDEMLIETHLRDLLAAGADMLITTGGMSVDPDDVTRHAIRRLGATEITYGTPVLPGAMFLVAWLKGSEEGNGRSIRSDDTVPVLGIPACGMYARTTVFDIILPRVLAGERIGREEIARLGHGGLCLGCPECRYPVCPFGKA